MATIKAYTTIEQSRKLAEILPLESADMRYGHIASYDFSDRMYDGGYDKVPYPKDFLKLCADFCEEDIYDGSLPCWSLASLLDVLPDGTDIIKDKTDTENEKYMCTIGIKNDIISTFGNNPVDACVAMIIMLSKNGLI